MTALIGPEELAARRGEVRVLDVQYALMGPPSRELYAAEHLPGAPHLPLEHALAGPAGSGGRHPLPDPAVLEGALRACGIGEGDAVVVYDQGSSLAAGRAWWVLRWAGLEDVSVLDGGLAAWKRAGLPVVSGVDVGGHDPTDARTAVSPVVVRPGSLPVLSIDEAADWAKRGRLFDVRAPERYRGESEPIDPVAGHIPGAVNLPMALMQCPDGTFRSPSEIEAAAAAAGAVDGGAIGVSCGSGVTAAQMVLALAEAGIEAVPYIGSWSGWIADGTRPVAIGPDRFTPTG